MASRSEDVTRFLSDSVQNGFKDGNDYHQYRPTYTEDVINTVVELLVLKSGSAKQRKTILELGAGTGKFTQTLLPKLPSNVSLIASEPVLDFYETLKVNCPNTKLLNCAAERIPLNDQSVHGIVAAQSFHWFYNRAALNELYRILVPDCCLVLLWNYNDRRVDWIDQFKSKIDPIPNDPHQYHSMAWKAAIDDYSGFQMDRNEIVQGQVLEGDVNFMLNHCSTHTGIKKFDESRRLEKLEDIRQLLLTHKDTKGKNTIQLPFFTDIYCYKKV